MTQCERILRHLKDYGELSSRDAMIDYGIMRLASRIHDLKAAGYVITKEMVNAENRYGEPTSYAVYRLEQ